MSRQDPSKPKRILLIEDDAGIRESTKAILDLHGFETFLAKDGLEGVTLARKLAPALIVCDIMMPKLDGFGVLRELRQAPQTAVIPFIYLSAKANPGEIREGMALGADDYLTKPFNPTDLLETIKTRLSRRAAFTQDLEQLRSDLSRSVPHEFRTPLNGILGFSQIILQNLNDNVELSKEELLDFVTQIDVSGKRLLRLVETFSLYTEVTSAASNDRPMEFDLAGRNWLPNLETCLREVAERFDRARDFSSSCAPGDLQISEYFLTRALSQLVDNALKFSGPGTPVTLAGSVNRSDYVFSVSDQGRGMSPEQVGRIGPFTQFDRGKFEQQGSGLGLAIVQKIATLFHGNLVLESTQGKSTTAYFSVPLSTPADLIKPFRNDHP